MATLLIGTFLIIVLAGIAQAVSGFGFMLVGVPLLALLLGPQQAVPVGLAIGQAIAVLGWYQERTHVEWSPVWTLCLATAVGLPAGIFVFTALPPGPLQVVIGLVVITATVLLLVKVRVPSGRPTQLGGGALAGVLLGSSGMPGPVFVIVLQTLGLGPHAFRATLQAVFTITGFVGLGAFLLAGGLTWDSLWLILAGLPGTWVGWRLGDLVFARLDAATLRTIVLVTLFASGLTMLVRGLTA